MKTRILFAMLCAAFAADAANPLNADQPWFERSLVGMEVGPTGAQFGSSDTNDTRYSARFDGQKIVRHARSANSEYLLLWVRDGDYAYYNSNKLLRSAVRFLNPSPRVEITAPASVEAVVTDDPVTRVLRVHLLGYNSPPQTTPAKERPFVLPRPIEDAPIYRATITSNQRLRGAKALSSSTRLQRLGNQVNLTVEDIHEVVILQY